MTKLLPNTCTVKPLIKFLITSFSQYTTICSFHILIRFSMSILNLHFRIAKISSAKQISTACGFHLCASKDFIANFVRLVGPSGLEPPTSCLSGTRSNLLSYEPMWLVWIFSHLNFSLSRSENFICEADFIRLRISPLR